MSALFDRFMTENLCAEFECFSLDLAATFINFAVNSNTSHWILCSNSVARSTFSSKEFRQVCLRCAALNYWSELITVCATWLRYAFCFVCRFMFLKCNRNGSAYELVVKPCNRSQNLVAPADFFHKMQPFGRSLEPCNIFFNVTICFRTFREHSKLTFP